MVSNKQTKGTFSFSFSPRRSRVGPQPRNDGGTYFTRPDGSMMIVMETANTIVKQQEMAEERKRQRAEEQESRKRPRVELEPEGSTPTTENESAAGSPNGSGMTESAMQMDLGSSPAPNSRKRKVKKQEPKKPAFRVNRPVKTEVNIDAWTMILKRCHPRAVAAMSQMNRNFHSLLHKNSHVWRESRARTFGADCPPVPTGMTEQHYSELLEGHGCHKCRIRNCRKVYWLLKERLCNTCLPSRLRSERSLCTFGMDPDLMDRIFHSIPHCVLDPWGGYGKVGPTTREPRGYDLATFLKVYEEVKQMVGASTPEEVMDEYFAKKRDEAQKIMAELGAAERFAGELKRAKAVEAKDLKKKRSDYFEERAMKLDPPLLPEALKKIDAFKKAVECPRPPSETSWIQLAPKLQQHRAVAEKMVQEDELYAAETNGSDGGNGIDGGDRSTEPEFQRIQESFYQARPPASVQLLDEVIELQLNETLSYLKEIFLYSHIPELGQLIPMLIKKVEERYSITRDLRADKLYMEDTKRVIQKLEAHLKLDPRFKRADDALPLLDEPLFRCPVCTGPNKNTFRSYPSAITHVAEVHSSSTVGDFMRWRRTSKGVFWKSVWVHGWVKNVPILSTDFEPTGRWNLDDTTPYSLPAPRPSQTPASNPLRGRYLCNTPFQGFDENIRGVLTMFKGVALDAKYKSQISFMFAVQQYLRMIGHRRATPRPGEEPYFPPIDVMFRLHEQLILDGEREAFEGFRCKKCVKDPPKTRPVKRPLPFGELVEHYNIRVDHMDCRWVYDLFDFPSTNILGSVLEKNDHARAVFDKLFLKQPLDPNPNHPLSERAKWVVDVD